MRALQAGLATLPGAAAMIAITPLITPLAVRLGGAGGRARLRARRRRLRGARLRQGGLDLPGVRVPAGRPRDRARDRQRPGVLGLHPRLSAQVGQALGISNMARYIGGAIAVAIVATIFNAVTNNHQAAGDSDADALAAGLARRVTDHGRVGGGRGSRSCGCWPAIRLLHVPSHRSRRRGGGDHAHDPDLTGRQESANGTPRRVRLAVKRESLPRALASLVLVAALGVLGLLSAASTRAQSRPSHWDPRRSRSTTIPANTFLLRPGQLLVGPGDGRDVARVLGAGWRADDAHPYGITLFTHRSPPAQTRPTRRARRDRPGAQDHLAASAGRRRDRARLRARRRGSRRPPDQLLRRAARPGRPGIERARRLATGGDAAAHDDPDRRHGRAHRRARHRPVHEPVADRRDRSARQRRRLGRRPRRLRRRGVRPRHVHRRADPAGRARRLDLRVQGARLARGSATTSAWRRRSRLCRPTCRSSTCPWAATPTATRRRWP